MEHGKRFVNENPEIGMMLEQLYVKRELDGWYKNKCAQEIEIPNSFQAIQSIKNMEVKNSINPSSEIYIQMHDLKGADGFWLGQQITLKISKLAPVFIMDFCYQLRHNLIDGLYDIVGTAESLELIQASNQIRRIMEMDGYIELSYLYDFYDTVYEWDSLQDIQPFNRRFTLGEALFTDVLELC
ncbi:hypothetical protein [Paenibacillus albidus]|nr:hypothetical protein [Paenibacillus albidus]